MNDYQTARRRLRAELRLEMMVSREMVRQAHQQEAA